METADQGVCKMDWWTWLMGLHCGIDSLLVFSVKTLFEWNVLITGWFNIALMSHTPGPDFKGTYVLGPRSPLKTMTENLHQTHHRHILCSRNAQERPVCCMYPLSASPAPTSKAYT